MKRGDEGAFGVVGVEGGGLLAGIGLAGRGHLGAGLADGGGEAGDVFGGDVPGGEVGFAFIALDRGEDVVRDLNVFDLGLIKVAARLGLRGGRGCGCGIGHVRGVGLR